ncbi:hypothetical protein [Bacillus sp. N1-1]|uniref:hypothetical protein n=1 Tax=Bacillus sp. N1-1 TaxID=2682541 RepID=UPI00131924E1|nr:hypothetical protein [Bacillus sp. N1-1]QHA90166.1 hypothetical protein GNK04_01050 [Bacillus sp. N1-1]
MYQCTMQDAVVTIVPTSRYGKEFDTATVQTYFQLSSQLPEEEEFLVPSLEKIPEEDLRLFRAGNVEFAPIPKSVVAQEIKDFQEQVASGNKEEAKSDAFLGLASLYMQPVKMQPVSGNVYQLNYQYSIYPESDGHFYVRATIPFRGFKMDRGTVRFTTVLPAGAKYDSEGTKGEAIQGQVLEEQAETFQNGLTVLGFQYTVDPDFVVKYKY